MRLDAHHHFWHYDPVEFAWIDDAMKVIRRDFLPVDLQVEIAVVGIEGVVSVQARQSMEETAMLLVHARHHDFIKAVVGWVPLISPNVAQHLDKFADAPKFRGVRHVLQSEADERYMLRPDFHAGIRELTKRGLAYDVLIFERHLSAVITFVDQHPGQVFVLDHLAKPKIKDGVFEPWNSHIRELARRENVCCKLSGMVTEADYAQWTPSQLQPYAESVLEAFGPARVMFGSDWPVCLVAGGYRRWWETAQAFASQLSESEQAQLFGETAARAYQL